MSSGIGRAISNFKSASLAATFLFATTCPSAAQTAQTARKPFAEPSVYLRCDGNPAHRSTGELLGRALLAGATLGLAGLGEIQDVSKRAHSMEGVDACDEALLSETDPARKVQLMLARSVHHIETGAYDAALDDARKAPLLAGPMVDDVGFRHSLLVSALELQAAVLVRAGRMAEAEAAAVEMANAAPYDVITQVRAGPYMQLTAELTPAKQAYLDRLVKIFPEAMAVRATAHQWAGKYLDAAQDYADLIELRTAFSTGNNPAPPLPSALALRSVMLALGGRIQDSAAVAAETSAMLRVIASTGKTGLLQASVDAAEQALDFRTIVQDLAQGRAAAARTKFAARSHWSVPAAPAVAELAARLRQGAPAGELTGPLAKDPAALRNEALIANAGAITEADNAVASLFGAVRRPLDAAIYHGWSDDVWNIKTSVLMHKKAPNEDYAGELMVALPPPRLFTTPHPLSVASGEALLMHSALMAEARGAKGFELFPGRQRLEAFLVRFGNPGDAGMPAAVTFDAAAVIADLSGEFPNPNLKPAGAPAAH